MREGREDEGKSVRAEGDDEEEENPRAERARLDDDVETDEDGEEAATAPRAELERGPRTEGDSARDEEAVEREGRATDAR